MRKRKNTAAFARGVSFEHWAVAGLTWLALVAPAWSWEVPKEPALMGRETRASVGVGETLYDVARRHGFAIEHLAAANGLPVSLTALERDSLVLPAWRILPSSPPRPGMVVNLPERGFYLFGDGAPRFFPIAIGEPGRFATPTGHFSIIEKVKDPEWIAPEWAGLGENNVVEAGPDNPLGDRWIGLSSPGLGLHSTNNPASIGSATSHGCMRMYPEVARTVFDLVKTGWPVRIEYETCRVGLERTGIYVSAFPDVYGRGGELGKLREQFERDDLLGFYSETVCRSVLQARRGLPLKVVDLTPKAWLGADWFPAVRLHGSVFIEQRLLEALEVTIDYSLAERLVTLRRGDKSVTLPLYLTSESDRRPEQAFLSRGAGWFPARKALSSLGLSMTWEASENRLRVER